jgi:hypothetical protein
VTGKISYKPDSRRSLPKRSYKIEARDRALLACIHGPGPRKPQTTGGCTYSPDDMQYDALLHEMPDNSTYEATNIFKWIVMLPKFENVTNSQRDQDTVDVLTYRLGGIEGAPP